MPDEENIVLKNKIAELKERLSQIYSQSAIEATKSKAFESEFSLYLKACEHARNERTEGIRLQHDATKFGLAVLIFVLALAAYVSATHILLGMLILLGFGVVSCGFMYLLLTAEIRIERAGRYCLELEEYFRRRRWSSEQNDAVDLPGIPLWDEYRSRWGRDLFAEGPYGRTAVYAPFRLTMTLTDLFALLYLVHSFVARGSEISWIVMAIGCPAWVIAVGIQMLFVDTIINKVGRRLVREEERPEGYQKKETGWKPASWIGMVKLFLALDILFPTEKKKEAD